MISRRDWSGFEGTGDYAIGRKMFQLLCTSSIGDQAVCARSKRADQPQLLAYIERLDNDGLYYGTGYHSTKHIEQ